LPTRKGCSGDISHTHSLYFSDLLRPWCPICFTFMYNFRGCTGEPLESFRRIAVQYIYTPQHGRGATFQYATTTLARHKLPSMQHKYPGMPIITTLGWSSGVSWAARARTRTYSHSLHSAKTTGLTNLYITDNSELIAVRRYDVPSFTNRSYSKVGSAPNVHKRCSSAQIRRVPVCSTHTPNEVLISPIASSAASKKSNTPRNRKMPPSDSKPVPTFLLSDIMAFLLFAVCAAVCVSCSPRWRVVSEVQQYSRCGLLGTPRAVLIDTESRPREVSTEGEVSSGTAADDQANDRTPPRSLAT